MPTLPKNLPATQKVNREAREAPLGDYSLPTKAPKGVHS